MTTCPSGVNYMHLIDHARKYIDKNYKRSFYDRLIRGTLSIILPNPTYFWIAGKISLLAKPLQFIFPQKIKEMIKLMPISFPKKTLPKMKVYRTMKRKKPIDST